MGPKGCVPNSHSVSKDSGGGLGLLRGVGGHPAFKRSGAVVSHGKAYRGGRKRGPVSGVEVLFRGPGGRRLPLPRPLRGGGSWAGSGARRRPPGPRFGLSRGPGRRGFEKGQGEKGDKGEAI